MVEITNLKFYSYNSRLFSGGFDYRQVFDKWRADYVYVEIKGEIKPPKKVKKDFSVRVKTAIFRIHTNDMGGGEYKLIGTFYYDIEEIGSFIRTIKFGDPKINNYWDVGEYVCIIYDDEQPLVHKYFFMEGQWKEEYANPLFSIVDIKTYEAPKDGLDIENREYTSSFVASGTRYITTEVTCKNLAKFNYQCELFIRVYDRNNNIKGEYNFIKKVTTIDDVFNLQNGWGNENGKSWVVGKYRYELYFLNRKLATFFIEVEEDSQVKELKFDLFRQKDKRSRLEITIDCKRELRFSLLHFISLFAEYLRELFDVNTSIDARYNGNRLSIDFSYDQQLKTVELEEAAKNYFNLLKLYKADFSLFEMNQTPREHRLTFFKAIKAMYHDILAYTDDIDEEVESIVHHILSHIKLL